MVVVVVVGGDWQLYRYGQIHHYVRVVRWRGGGGSISQLTGTSFQYHFEGDYPSSRAEGEGEERGRGEGVLERGERDMEEEQESVRERIETGRTDLRSEIKRREQC